MFGISTGFWTLPKFLKGMTSKNGERSQRSLVPVLIEKKTLQPLLHTDKSVFSWLHKTVVLQSIK